MTNELIKSVDKYHKKAIYELRQAQKLAKHSKPLNDKYYYWNGVVNALRNVNKWIDDEERIKKKRK